MHGSKLPLTVWFWATYLMATHSNGISARQMWWQLDLGSYKVIAHHPGFFRWPERARALQ